ncbi:MAG: DUF4192 domain-containing protein [Geodermatophilaceae bacterium]|nr:DUF4192 domain-containing protein [Geodermatophilaceae bacterium]
MDSTPKLRLSGPGSLIAAVPHLLGFPPEQSLVLVGLSGPRSRVGITLRADLPLDGADHAPSVAELAPLVEALRRDGASECLAMIMTDCPDDDGLAPYVDLVANLDEALFEGRVDVGDIVLVRAGRWRSYLCPDPHCCPAQGSAVPAPSGELAAYAAYSGAVVRDSRTALIDMIAPDSEAISATERALGHVGREMAEASSAGTSDAYRERIEELIDRRVRAVAAGTARSLNHRDAARISVALIDRPLRDRVAGHCLRQTASAAESLWIDLLRRLPAPLDAAPATLLALSSWARGDGAMANVALDRALDSDPGYSLAQLVRTALDHALPPATVREMLDFPASEAG